MVIATLVRAFVPLVFFGVFLLLPTVASAQSSITGLVRDTTGAVLPGVTVEVASPVLIEKTRTGVSDGEGRYTIVDLRPGTYTVTFTLAGFNTLKREGLELPANFTATINADMPVGALEESVTVTGASPVVDVSTTQRTQVLSRDMLDSVPSARNYSGLASLMPGVRTSNTDVGGNQQMEQIYMTVHGSRQTDTTVQVDGMQLNSLMNNGQVQAYFSDAASSEVSFQTSGVGADVSTGGVRINMIPKEGGNRFSGSAFIGGTDGRWQSNNVSQELIDKGLTAGDRVGKIQDFNFSLGGPVMRDKLWFFTSWRRIATDEVVANNFYPDGSQGVEDQWIQNQMVRLTWQMTQSNKLTAYHDRYPKFKGHELGALQDPVKASMRRDPEHARYYTGQVKWTSTVTPRILLESGYSTNIEHLLISYQPGIRQERNSAGWFSGTRHQDILTGVLTNAGSVENGIYPDRHALSSVMSYVTGSHNIKTGVQWSFGDYRLSYEANGDLYQIYQDGVPSFVTVFNTPVYARERLNRDMGIFVQDAWTKKRLTLNAGVRFESFNAQIKAQGNQPGRFAGLREIDASLDQPDWFDVTPRLGAAYDLFGNAKTAIKFSVNKYMAGQTTGFPARYNPNQLQTERRTWTDRDLSGRSLPTNGDDIAQDNEIGPSSNSLFGTPRSANRHDPDLQREYDWVYDAGIQHEVRRGLAVTANWFRRSAHDLSVTQNTLVSLNDYTPFEIFNPLDGSPITLYNLSQSKFQQVDRIDTNSTNSDLRNRVFNGFEFGFNSRFGRGSAFGAYTFDRSLSANCDGSSATGATATDPNTFRFCDDRNNDVPFRHDVKFAGSYILPWQDIQLNAAFQSYTGASRTVTWTVSRTTRYPLDCPAPCVPNALVAPNLVQTSLAVPLIAPDTQYLPRHNQLDFGVRKLFQIANMQWSGQIDIFNMTNSGIVKTETSAFGPSLGRPTSILQPRTLRLAAQMRF
jgi:hypothetical protein